MCANERTKHKGRDHMIANICLGIFCIVLLFALFDVQSKLNKLAEVNETLKSRARLLERLNNKIAKRDELWAKYAGNLEKQIVSMQDSLYSQTIRSEGSQYTLPAMPKAYGRIADPEVMVHGKLVKLSTLEVKAEAGNNGNGNGKTPQNAPQQDTATKTAVTLADLGTITSKEQSLIDKWHKSSTPDSEIAKRIANIRASNERQNNK